MIPYIKNILGLKSDAKIIEHGAVIVDVRGAAEFASGHINGAVNIPLEVVESKAHDLKKYPQVVVYCRSGNRSGQARRILVNCGVNDVLDAGSINEAQILLKGSGKMDASIIKDEIGIKDQQNNDHKDVKLMRVLIPTDFSVQADYSYFMVKKLEEHLNIEIHFLHIMDVPDTVTMDDNGILQTCGEIDVNYIKDQKKIAEQKLTQLCKQYGDQIHVHLKLGKITDTIVHFAAQNNFDLIVMGTKGSHGLQEKLSSTQAQLIARISHVPVLSLMCDRSDLIISDVLLVHDFMSDNKTNLPLLHKFSEYFNAKYHFLYIHENSSSVSKDDVLAKMDAYASSHGITKFEKHMLTAGDIESGVKTFLMSQDADIVFIGTHGKGGFFHKSAAESLIKHLFKPIISFHL